MNYRIFSRQGRNNHLWHFQGGGKGVMLVLVAGVGGLYRR